MAEMMSTVLLLAIVLGSILAVYVFFEWQNRKLEDERKRFASFKEILKAHYRATDEFIDHPDSPSDLVNLLAGLQTLIGDREFARGLAQVLNRGAEVRHDEGVRSLRHELHDMARLHPELADTFAVALETGMIACLLHWPETAKEFMEAISNLARHREVGTAYVIRANSKVPMVDGSRTALA